MAEHSTTEPEIESLNPDTSSLQKQKKNLWLLGMPINIKLGWKGQSNKHNNSLQFKFDNNQNYLGIKTFGQNVIKLISAIIHKYL